LPHHRNVENETSARQATQQPKGLLQCSKGKSPAQSDAAAQLAAKKTTENRRNKSLTFQPLEGLDWRYEQAERQMNISEAGRISGLRQGA
jgi:hypothetical protein